MFEGYVLAFNFIAGNPMAIVVTMTGLLIGIIFGALPGLSGTIGVAIFIPVTFTMHPTTGIVFLASLYVGSAYGGAITAILFNIPGSPEAACTALDGYPLAKKGQASKALGAVVGTSALSSVIAVIVLALVSPPLARAALAFGPGEYFALAFFGLSAIASIEAKSFYKALTSGLLGLLIATIGYDPLSHSVRYTFGARTLVGGFSYMPIIIGVFAIAEVLARAAQKNLGVVKFGEMKGISIELPSMKEWFDMKVTFLRSFILGAIIGTLPGVGATTAAFVAYSEEVRWSKNPKLYGTGVLNGVVAPETANQSAAACAMIPLLALGIPGSATTAVMIGGLTIHGIQPGPLMMVMQKQMVYTIFVTMFIASFAMLILGMFMTRLFAYVLKVNYTILAPIIGIFCIVGVFAINNSTFELVLTFFVAVAGYLFKKYEYPIAPLIIGVVLGKLAEENLRRGLSVFNMDLVAMFVMKPITAVLMALSIACLVYGLYNNIKKERKLKEAVAAE